MTAEKLAETVTELDEDVLARYFDMETKLAAKPKKRPLMILVPIAACIALVCAAVVVPMLRHGGPITPPIDGPERQASEDTKAPSESSYKIINLSPDWPYYKSFEEIVAASTNIFTGKVKSITFDVINMKTGKIDNSTDSDNTDRMLYTIYTIDVLSSLKGENAGEIKICRIGGTPGYNEEEQYKIICSSGLDKTLNGIPMITGDVCNLKSDDECLFCTSRTVGDFDFIINQTQFAHKIDSEDCKSIIEAVG